jgi:7-keto-8-aminopelargonate synthetase-like enzyme
MKMTKEERAEIRRCAAPSDRGYAAHSFAQLAAHALDFLENEEAENEELRRKLAEAEEKLDRAKLDLAVSETEKYHFQLYAKDLAVQLRALDPSQA